MSQEQMTARLREFFPNASQLEVVDLTGGGDHWEVFVHCASLAGLSRIQQHQKVMGAFQAELKSGEVHALAIKTQG